MRRELTGHYIHTSDHNYHELSPKPIEMYVFLDPLCPECWSLEPYIRKLSIEYGRFFTHRSIVSTLFHPVNSKRQSNREQAVLQKDNDITCPWNVSIAMKAAEIQGKKSSKMFFRKLQEYVFIKNQDVSKEEILIEIAKEIDIDVDEFIEDLHGTSAKKAFQCDVKLTREMEITHTPTIVFFNHDSDDCGIKIPGVYPYEVYELILQELLEMIPIPSQKPPLEIFIRKHGIVSSHEISVIYDWTPSKTEKELKKLQFKQCVQRLQIENKDFWKYVF